MRSSSRPTSRRSTSIRSSSSGRATRSSPRASASSSIPPAARHPAVSRQLPDVAVPVVDDRREPCALPRQPEAKACPSIYTSRDRECWSINQKKIMRWLSAPRVFEIGRTAAFDFSRAPAPVEDMDGTMPRRGSGRSGSGRGRCPARREISPRCAVDPSASTAMYPEPAARWIQGASCSWSARCCSAASSTAPGAASPAGSGRRAEHVAEAAARLDRGAVALLGLALIVVAYLGMAPLWHVLASAVTQGHRRRADRVDRRRQHLADSADPLARDRLSIWFICRSWRALNAESRRHGSHLQVASAARGPGAQQREEDRPTGASGNARFASSAIAWPSRGRGRSSPPPGSRRVRRSSGASTCTRAAGGRASGASSWRPRPTWRWRCSSSA